MGSLTDRFGRMGQSIDSIAKKLFATNEALLQFSEEVFEVGEIKAHLYKVLHRQLQPLTHEL